MSGSKYTFKSNRDRGRHGWLRLTPAYSVHLVEELVDTLTERDTVLDPFCGTGTTALVCANRGIVCATVDINPFLVWLTRVKVKNYRLEEIEEAKIASRSLSTAISLWAPPMQFIERWWSAETITALSSIRSACRAPGLSDGARSLMEVAFCQTVMGTSKANFRHQSMSLKHDISQKIQNPSETQTAIFERFAGAIETICMQALAFPTLREPCIHTGDSCELGRILEINQSNIGRFTSIVTSPPYANRMSYVRELRPYMYWLGFLESGQQAGELDWKAIGGTWGRATSNLMSWSTDSFPPIDKQVTSAIASIEARSPVLGRYLRKYICDMYRHLVSLRPLLAPGASVSYIVGNSRFYEYMVDTEQIFAQLFELIGLERIEIVPLRKRTSKRELFEFCVSGIAP